MQAPFGCTPRTSARSQGCRSRVRRYCAPSWRGRTAVDSRGRSQFRKSIDLCFRQRRDAANELTALPTHPNLLAAFQFETPAVDGRYDDREGRIREMIDVHANAVERICGEIALGTAHADGCGRRRKREIGTSTRGMLDTKPDLTVENDEVCRRGDGIEQIDLYRRIAG